MGEVVEMVDGARRVDGDDRGVSQAKTYLEFRDGKEDPPDIVPPFPRDLLRFTRQWLTEKNNAHNGVRLLCHTCCSHGARVFDEDVGWLYKLGGVEVFGVPASRTSAMVVECELAGVEADGFCVLSGLAFVVLLYRLLLAGFLGNGNTEDSPLVL